MSSPPTPPAPYPGPRPPRDLRRDLPTIGATVVVLAVAATHLVAHVLAADTLRQSTQWLLMPALALFLAVAGRPVRDRLQRLVLLALGFSWLGDLLPSLVPDGAAFLVMIGCFFLAQVTYVVAFAPYVHGGLGRHPWAAVPYALVLTVMLVLVLPGAGALTVPLVLYGLVLVAMAVLALGVDRATAVGAAVFLVSDALIAVDRFVAGYRFDHQGITVMATYLLGQGLITLGVMLHVRRVPVD